jgi:hypothetical protein
VVEGASPELCSVVENPLFHPLRLSALLLVAAPALSQEAPKPFVERVNVDVRSVLVVMTKPDGKPLSGPPPTNALEVRENGVPVEIVGIDAARASLSPSEALPRHSAPPAMDIPPGATEGIRQYLYLDSAFLQARSVRKVADVFLANIDSILANGPLEIVVADAEPRSVLARTADRGRIREALDSLRKNLKGRELFISNRRETLGAQHQGGHIDIRASISQESAMLRVSLEKLEGWASRQAAETAGILYLANDGFDNPAEAYTAPEVFQASRRRSSSEEAQQEADQMRLEGGATWTRLVGQTSERLAALGLTTVGVALGGSIAEFPASAANFGKIQPGSSSVSPSLAGAPTFLLQRPLEGLRLISDAGGGEVVSDESRFGRAVDRYASAYRVYFRSAVPADGHPRRLEVRARRADLAISAPRYVSGGTPEALVAARTVRIAEGSAVSSAPGFPVEVSVEDLKAAGSRRSGILRVRADFTEIASTLDKLGGAHVRVTVAVEMEGGQPFVTHEEMDAARDDAGNRWTYEAPLTLPKQARRIAVTVEELKTGAQGAGAVSIPLP